MKIRMGSIHGSTFIKAAGISGAAGDSATLRIQFDDALLDFAQVPFAIFKSLVRNKDRAHFYLRNIQGAYSYKTLTYWRTVTQSRETESTCPTDQAFRGNVRGFPC
jgi:KTSC domain